VLVVVLVVVLAGADAPVLDEDPLVVAAPSDDPLDAEPDEDPDPALSDAEGDGADEDPPDARESVR
jgi:hypothetical protein